MQKYEETLRRCEDVELEDLIEIGGVLYEVAQKFENPDDILLELSLITVISTQNVRPKNDAWVRLPRNLLIKTLK